MQQNISKKITDCLNIIDQCKLLLRRQNLKKGLYKLQCFSQEFMLLFDDIIKEQSFFEERGIQISIENITGMLGGILGAQDSEDYVLVADLLELQIQPFLLEMQAVLVTELELFSQDLFYKANIKMLRECIDFLENKQRTNLEEQRLLSYRKLLKLADEWNFELDFENVRLESTSNGEWTICVLEEESCYYMHSNSNPRTEAMIFAEHYYDIDKSHYMVLGWGLGYHIQALKNHDDGIWIDVFECNKDVILLAMKNMDLSWLFAKDSRIILHYDPEFEGMFRYLEEQDEVEIVIHQPSMRRVKNNAIREKLEQIFIRDSGIRNMEVEMRSNFRDNIISCNHYVSELKNQFKGKKVVIVAAGPSLDKNIHVLRDRGEHTVVLCVGTAFRKLVRENILPDYVIFLDGQPNMTEQIEGFDTNGVSALIASTAYKGIAGKYQGEKYLICQKDYPPAEQYASEKDYELFETGGSVSTIALDVAIRLQSAQIAFAGLDLAYTNNYAHAADTSNVYQDGIEEMKQVPAIGGGTVPTSKIFQMYNRWIAERVKRMDVTMPVVDATEGGAVIPGLEIMSLEAFLLG